jgi:hypothetical protein
MKKLIGLLVTAALAVTFLAVCPLPPTVPITCQDLVKVNVYNTDIIDGSPEELLNALNTRGKIIVERKRDIPDRDFPVYVKLVATSEGVHSNEYDQYPAARESALL